MGPGRDGHHKGYPGFGVLFVVGPRQYVPRRLLDGRAMFDRESGIANTPPEQRDYPRLLRSALLVCALLFALLPIPFALLRLLPAYDMHARFLAFYAPVVCLLMLAYLLYVRDSLARLMFANILDPLPDSDPYYRMTAGEAIQRGFRQVQAAVLALLPVVLLATSFYCLVRYTDRLRESAAIAAAVATELPATGEEVGRAAPDSVAEPPPGVVRDAARGAYPAPATAPDTSAAVAEPAPPPREEILRSAGIDAIPMFTELTILYIGIFASALLAVILMALKEYAKEAMGLSEQEMVVGRYASIEDAVATPMLAPPPGD